MGDVKRILITGAAGYLGREITRQALADGLKVTALIRRPDQAGIFADYRKSSNFSVVAGDLCDGLQAEVGSFDAVIHAAANVGGSHGFVDTLTLTATNSLLDEMAKRDVGRLVLVSSISVYDYTDIVAHTTIDETSKLESQPQKRDAYCRTKLAQESACQNWAKPEGRRLSILRPGLLYGNGRFDNPLLGITKGKLMMVFGHQGELPMSHVKNAARAAVMAAQADEMLRIANVVDDDLPRVRDYLRWHKLPVLRVTIPWRVLDAIALLLSPLQSRLPGLLRRRVLRARAAPFQFSNAMLKQCGWAPDVHADSARKTPSYQIQSVSSKAMTEGAGP